RRRIPLWSGSLEAWRLMAFFYRFGPVDPLERWCDRRHQMIEAGQRGRNMALRSKLVVGNWKMNGSRGESGARARELARRACSAGGVLGCELVVCPPAPLLGTVADGLAGSGIALGGQDCHAAPKGPHTGDISAEMLADLGCKYVILGHSERR